MTTLTAFAAHDAQLARLLVPVLGVIGQLRVFFGSEIALVASGAPGRRAAAAQVERGTTVFDHFVPRSRRSKEAAAVKTEVANAHQDSLFDRLAAFVGIAGLASVLLVVGLAWQVPRRSFRLLRDQQLARAETDRLRQEAEAVQTLTAELSSAVTVDDVHAAVGATGRALLGADAVSIALLEPGSDRIEVWSSGPAGESDPAAQSLAAAAEPTGRAVVTDGQARFLDRLEDDADGAGALALLPLAAPRRRPRGYLALHYRDGRAFPASEQARLRVVCGQIESALSRASIQDQDRRTAEELQRALLPASLPAPAAARLVAYYRPGSEGTIVGGDWYDAVERDDGTIAGSVGDVAGHGIPAAAQMGRLRHSYRAYALEHRSPAEILARLTHHIAPDAMATALCFDIDPAAGLLRYCSAGHPPAILYSIARRETTLLDELHAPPLGAATPADFVDARVQIEPGTVIFAYTDGLVEHRRVNLSERIQTLAERVAGGSVDDLQAYVAGVVDAMEIERGNPDDIAVLAIAL